MYSSTNFICNKQEINHTGQNVEHNFEHNLNIVIAGLGGLGVVSLAKKLRNLVADRYTHVHSIEQRGVAQRRSTSSATVRAANHYIAPALGNTKANSLIALEALEALRYVHLLDTDAKCLISDFRLGPTANEKNYPCASEIKAMLEKTGASCQVLPVAEWLKKEQMLPVHVSIVMLGAFCGSLNIERNTLETFINENLKDSKNKKAFQWGLEQYQQLQTPFLRPVKTNKPASPKTSPSMPLLAAA